MALVTYPQIPQTSPGFIRAQHVLDLEDLLPDSEGEIVARMTGLDLIVATERALAATGTADAHVTAAGENVAALETSLLFGTEPV